MHEMKVSLSPDTVNIPIFINRRTHTQIHICNFKLIFFGETENKPNKPCETKFIYFIMHIIMRKQSTIFNITFIMKSYLK